MKLTLSTWVSGCQVSHRCHVSHRCPFVTQRVGFLPPRGLRVCCENSATLRLRIWDFECLGSELELIFTSFTHLYCTCIMLQPLAPVCLPCQSFSMQMQVCRIRNFYFDWNLVPIVLVPLHQSSSTNQVLLVLLLAWLLLYLLYPCLARARSMEATLWIW